MTPYQAIELLRLGSPPQKMDISQLWVFVVGGDTITEHHLDLLRNLVPRAFVFQFYGMTEIGGAVTTFRIDHLKDILLLRHKPHSIGMIKPGIDCMVSN